MNLVYIRMVFYAFAPLAALTPSVTFNSDAFTVMVDLEAAALGLSAGIAGVVAVFGAWGKK
tara:strand:+ start:791 stop:973 length:183 start_codon:yes stop_codon:yes gene_type:complete